LPQLDNFEPTLYLTLLSLRFLRYEYDIDFWDLATDSGRWSSSICFVDPLKPSFCQCTVGEILHIKLSQHIPFENELEFKFGF